MKEEGKPEENDADSERGEDGRHGDVCLCPVFSLREPDCVGDCVVIHWCGSHGDSSGNRVEDVVMLRSDSQYRESVLGRGGI